MKRLIGVAVIFCGVQAENLFTEHSSLYYGTYSDTFVQRWGIQERTHFSYDPRLEAFPTDPERVAIFDPAAVKEGDIIFVRDVSAFMKVLHPQIKSHYIMVTAGDYKDAMKSQFLTYLDEELIIAWFCVHPCPRSHPKYHWLPLGIFQQREFYTKRRQLNKLFSLWRTAPKEKLLYCNFGLRTHSKPERDEIYDRFSKADFCTIGPKVPFLEYMKVMSEFKFTLSPRGVAPDTYRTWEALLVGCIPVLESCYLDELYADLPVLIVDDWSKVTRDFLEEEYKKIIAKKYNIEKLYMEYWWNKIETVRTQFLSQFNT